MLGIDNSAEGVEPQDKQDLTYYLAPCMMTLLVLLGAVYRTMNKPRLGCVLWCKQGSTQIQALFKCLGYGAGSVPWWSQGSSTLIRGTGMFLLAVWDLGPNVIVSVVLSDHKYCIHGHECNTWMQDQLYELDTTMIRTANEKRVVVGTTNGTD